MAGVVRLNHQHEFLRNAALARDFEQGAGGDRFAHAAVDAAGAVEGNAAGFQGAVGEILRRSTGSTSTELDAPPLSLRFIVSSIGASVHETLRSAAARIEQWWNYSRPGLSDCETDRRNTNDTVRNW